ncbi:MAG: helix-turn-helix domain-containing protein [Candidatus Micrarchaeota archaeon]
MRQGILEMIGLTEGEAKTYRALLRLGSSSTGAISSEAGVSTSKLYIILDKLEKKGLVSHIDVGGVRRFQAVEPARIRDYLRKKKQEVEELETEFEAQLPGLMQLYAHPEAMESVTVFKGFSGMKVAHEHTYLKLKKGDEYLVLGVPQFPLWESRKPKGQFARFWEKDHQRRDRAGIKARMLFNTDADRALLENRNRFALCEARYMPIDIRTPAYFTIYKDTVLLTTITAEPVCIEITSRDISAAFKKYFEDFWKRSKPFR